LNARLRLRRERLKARKSPFDLLPVLIRVIIDSRILRHYQNELQKSGFKCRMAGMPLTVAWISDFPVEWLPDLPAPLKALPKGHSASWQRVLLEEFEANSKIKLHVFTFRKQVKGHFPFERNGVVFHVLKTRAGMRAPTLFWTDSLMLRPRLKEISPDVVHAWGSERGAALVANRMGYPYVMTVQGLLSWYAEIVPLNGYERFGTWLEKLSMRRAPLVTTESDFAIRYLETRFPSVRCSQVEHAPNWIFHRLERKPSLQPIRFLFVGTAGWRKGTDLLLAALDQLKDAFAFELVIVGGFEAQFLKNHRETFSKELWRHVTLKENLSAAEVAAEVSQSTMLLFPTRADTSPNAVKEAVVAGLPVVGSRIGGILDYVIPGRNGMTFESENLQEFVEAIKAAVAHPLLGQGKVDPETLAKMREYLSPSRMADGFLRAYHTVLKK
jgi:glycosyltransferase involved in cell wall biosynthesis